MSKKRKHDESSETSQSEEEEEVENEVHGDEDDEEEDDVDDEEYQFGTDDAEEQSADDNDDEESDEGTEWSQDSDAHFNYDGYSSNDYDEDCTKPEVNQEEEIKSEEMFEMSGIMSKLPTEIFFEILSRVPVKSLSRCRWVSKAWFNAIKHPRFVEMHHNKVIQNKSFCVLSYELDEKIFSLINHENLEAFETDIPYDTPILPRPLPEMDSCNGLVFSRRQPYFICNPITGEHMVIPKPPMSRVEDIVTGFGFDPVSQVFKVVRVMEEREKNYNGETIAQVYNFGTGKWRLIPKVPYRFDSTKSNVFVNGALHWIGFPYDKSMKSEIIISFKLDIEEFQEVPLPLPSPPPSPPWHHFFGLSHRDFEQYLCTLDECLCIVRTVRDNHIEIWVMKEYGLQSSWVDRYTIENIRVDGDCESGPYKPLQLMKNGNLLMLCSHHDLGYYDCWENYLDCIYIGTGIYCVSVLQPLLHAESLISPKSVGKLRKSKRNYGSKFCY